MNGVWRVQGVLATSRALGDYPLKERKVIVSEPDVLSFKLSTEPHLRPEFAVLASDGLWDIFRYCNCELFGFPQLSSQSSVTRFGDLLDFGQLFKASGNNYFPPFFGNFCVGVKIIQISSETIFGQLL